MSFRPRAQQGQWREGLVDWAASQLHNTLTGVEVRGPPLSPCALPSLLSAPAGSLRVRLLTPLGAAHLRPQPLRGLAGAGPNTKHAPEDLETWRPCKWTGGALDRKA